MGAMPQPEQATQLSIDAEAAAKHLNRILTSKSFRQADRLKRFLRFIVTETVEGRGEALKEFIVGVEVFDRNSSFDPRSDPIVRVQARRLRAQLERYYLEEGTHDEIVLEVPKGGYAAVIRRVEPTRSSISKRPANPLLVNRNTVLAMPFMDLSPSGDLKYFCEGLSQEIIHTLTGKDGVRLVGWSGAPTTPSESGWQEAASRFNAAIVITGSVRRSEEVVRVTTNLIETSNNCFLWSHSIDGDSKDPIALQEEIAGAISKRLESELAEGARYAASGRRPPAQNLAAYNYFVQGRYHLNQRTEEGLRKAVEFFEKATAEDGQYAQAYAGLADAYVLLGHYGAVPPTEVWTKTASNAAWAVLCDDLSAEAHTSLAHVKSTQDWDWLGAEREFQRAIILDSQYATAHHWYAASMLAPVGRSDDALNEMRIAQALDPISPIIARDLARIYYYLGDYEAALEQCDHTIELDPHFTPAYSLLGFVQEQRGEFEESAAAFQRAIQLSPQSPSLKAALGHSYGLAGKKSKAIGILKEIVDLATKRYVSPFELALLHFSIGQADEGFKWFEKAFNDRCFELIVVKVDPRLDRVKSDPRFVSQCAKLGLP
jgi:TolB-like protein/Flp pilus assembly protein TadD